MYMLIVLLYPIICKYIKSNKNRLTLFLLITIVQQLGSLYYKWMKFHPFDFVYYFCLFELGVIFFNYIKSKRQISNKIFILYIIILIVSTIIKDNIISSVFNQILLNPISCITFYKISVKFSDIRILNYIGRYSFYIYLFHEPIFMKYIAKFIDRMGLYNNWLPIPIVGIGGMIMSIITYKIFIKFKIGRYILNINTAEK